MENPPQNDVVLYKKLKPSILLMGLLIQKEISFTAQVKVPYLEDPILAIFLSLIESQFNTSESSIESLVLSLRAYFEIIGISFEDDKILKEIKESLIYKLAILQKNFAQ